MSRTLLILRPEPGASETAARAKKQGIEAVIAPLFATAPVAWKPPPAEQFDAVLMTSASAARWGGRALARYRHLPLYAVGMATAEAAQAAGFTSIRIGDGDVAMVTGMVAGLGVGSMLHLAGAHFRPPPDLGIRVERRIVYVSNEVDALPPDAAGALRDGAVALLHSPRAASLFRTLVTVADFDVQEIAVAAISSATLAAAGSGWRAVTAPAAPNDDALLAAAARLCE